MTTITRRSRRGRTIPWLWHLMLVALLSTFLLPGTRIPCGAMAAESVGYEGKQAAMEERGGTFLRIMYMLHVHP
jgi:hypothetical protein